MSARDAEQNKRRRGLWRGTASHLELALHEEALAIRFASEHVPFGGESGGGG
jgi:hypothetical protein